MSFQGEPHRGQTRAETDHGHQIWNDAVK
jgi:hypothetical protein